MTMAQSNILLIDILEYCDSKVSDEEDRDDVQSKSETHKEIMMILNHDNDDSLLCISM